MKSMKLIIGITGKQRSGKDTLANFLVDRLKDYNPVVLKFAVPLKRLVLAGLRLNVSPDEDEKIKSEDTTVVTVEQLGHLLLVVDRALRNAGLSQLSYPEVSTIMNLKGNPLSLVYRFLLQYVGTDVFRKRKDSYWVDLLTGQLKRRRKGVFIISDVRFQNEAASLKKIGGIIIKTIRKGKVGIINPRHPSETEVDNIVPDFTIEAFSIEELKMKAEKLLVLHFPQFSFRRTKGGRQNA